MECLPGAEIIANAADQSLLLTLVAKADDSESRILALKFATRDLRNSILTGLRCGSDFSELSQFLWGF